MIEIFLFIFFFVGSHIFFCRLNILDNRLNIGIIFIICVIIFFDFSKIFETKYLIFFFSLKISFLIIYIEFFSLISRGFTISILTSLDEKKFKKENIEKIYSGEKGLKWMLKKRINGMIFFKVLKIENNIFKLRFFGYVVLLLVKFSKQILNVRKLGQ